MADAKPLTKSKAVQEMWKRGIICQWKLDKNQLEALDMVQRTNEKIFVFNYSRRNGKSFLALCYSFEQCLKNPGYRVTYVASSAKMVRDITSILAEDILKDCPESLKPEISTNKNHIKFKNGSVIKLYGADAGRAQRIRGIASDLVIVDEAAFIDKLDVVVNSVLLPTTLTTNGKIILISTPPMSLDHPYMSFMKTAQLRGTFLQKTIYDNKRLTREQINGIIEASGGIDSNAVRREYLCIVEADTTSVVLPEFTQDVMKECIREWPLPENYDAYSSMDIGGRDMTALVYGFYDFRIDKIIIQDELALQCNTYTTNDLARLNKEKEKACWTNESGIFKPPYLRVADNNNIIMLNDLSKDKENPVFFQPTQKDDFLASLNNLKLLIKTRKIIIHPRCTTLISHLGGATWKGNSQTFSRRDGHHYDMVSALIYLCRNISYSRNPYPKDWKDPNHYHIPVTVKNDPPKTNPLENQIRELFKPKKWNRKTLFGR